MTKVKILDATHIHQKLNRLAFEVYENNFSEKELFVVGINGNGYKVAIHLCEKLKTISSLKIKLGKISVNKDKPWEGEPEVDFNEKDFVKYVEDEALKYNYPPQISVHALETKAK